MLNAITLNVVMLNVIMLSVMVPISGDISKISKWCLHRQQNNRNLVLPLATRIWKERDFQLKSYCSAKMSKPACVYEPLNKLWKEWVFAYWVKARWHKSQWHRFMCKHKSLTSPLSSNLVLKVKKQDDASCCSVCHGRFHGILPKEYSGTFHGLPWELY